MRCSRGQLRLASRGDLWGRERDDDDDDDSRFGLFFFGAIVMLMYAYALTLNSFRTRIGRGGLFLLETILFGTLEKKPKSFFFLGLGLVKHLVIVEWKGERENMVFFCFGKMRWESNGR